MRIEHLLDELPLAQYSLLIMDSALFHFEISIDLIKGFCMSQSNIFSLFSQFRIFNSDIYYNILYI